MPLVPPRAFGDVTQLDVGEPVQVGVVSKVVIDELSRNPLLELPTPKNNRSVVPSENSVNGEHSSPAVLSTTKVDEPVLVMTLLAKGKKNIFGFDGISGVDDVPDTNPQVIRWPEVDPFTQNLLSNAPEYALSVIQSPVPCPKPRSTVLLVVRVVELVKFAGIWLAAPPMPCTMLHPVNTNT